MALSAADVEQQALDIVREVKRSLRIPVAIKLAPLLTAFAHFAKQLEKAGADGLVLFTRFHRVDIDVDELDVIRTLPLSDSSELPLRLRGVAALAGRVTPSLAITGGVHTGIDVIKATMAGAHATQLVSALLRHGPAHLRTILSEIESWMEEHEWNSLDEMRGNMSLERIPDSAAVRARRTSACRCGDADAADLLICRGARRQRLSVLVDLDRLHRPDAGEQNDRRLLLPCTRTVPVHGVGNIGGERASVKRIRRAFVVDVAGADPPRPRDHVDPARLIVKVRSRECAGRPLDQHPCTAPPCSDRRREPRSADAPRRRST